MQLISCHDGKLVRVDSGGVGERSGDGFVTGVEGFDRLLPGGRLARGAVHEILSLPGGPRGMFVAGWLGGCGFRVVGSGKAELPTFNFQRSTSNDPLRPHPGPLPHAIERMGEMRFEARAGEGVVVWSDPLGELYPPALPSLGVSLDRLLVLRAGNLEEEVWGVAECLACRGVGVTVAVLPELTRLQARRLQLAAERGGGVGLLLRRLRRGQEHAAATRWLVEPARGERTVQRWKMQLIHGHGGRLGQVVYLEYCRETHRVRSVDELVGGSAEKARRRA